MIEFVLPTFYMVGVCLTLLLPVQVIIGSSGSNSSGSSSNSSSSNSSDCFNSLLKQIKMLQIVKKGKLSNQTKIL